MNKITSILLMLFLAVFVAGCSGDKNADTTKHEQHEKETHNEEGKDGHGHEKGESKLLSVSEESRNTMGLKLASVEYRGIEEALSVTGYTAKDTDKTHHVLASFQGTVIDVKAQYGDVVKNGSVLAVIKNLRSGIEEEIRSEQGGIVAGVNISQGQQVDDMTSLFTITDMSNIYANFDVYEKDAGKVQVGQRVTVTSVAYPNKTFKGKIVFISPRIDDASRTIKIRAEINNTDYLLKYNMFLNGKIILSGGQYIVVPLKAVQQYDNKHLVFVSNGKSEFEPRVIEIGFEDEEYVQVRRGLKSGEKIAVDGSFLLKSELLKSKMGEGCAE
ncbi:MAG: efflux RND transporter periplasmic adaptor subunit [Elusimicrobiota bacterium]